MRGRKGLFALAALVAVPLAALGLARIRHPETEGASPAKEEAEAKPAPRRPNVVGENEDGSEPGGTLVVLGLFGGIATIAILIAAFVFPPGYVAAVLTFGIVSLLGLVVLYVHYRAHHPLDHSTDDAKG